MSEPVLQASAQAVRVRNPAASQFKLGAGNLDRSILDGADDFGR